MKINIYKIFIYIGLFSINYNYGMESLILNNTEINSNSIDWETFNFFISFSGDMIYRINIKNKFKEVEFEEIKNISFYKVPLDKKNEKFVYIPKFGEKLDIEKFSNEQIFEIYKGFTILANDNENLKINEDDQSEIFKYLLNNNISEINDNFKLNRSLFKNIMANNIKTIYFFNIAATVRNLIVDLNSGLLIKRRNDLEKEISLISNELKKIDIQSLKKEEADLNEMKNAQMLNTEEYKEKLKKYKGIVNFCNKSSERLKYLKEELKYNKKIILIEGKDNSYKGLKKKYQKEVVFANSEEGQKYLKDQNNEIKSKIIENINQKMQEQSIIEYNEGLAEIKRQPDSLLQEMINAEKEKELIKSGNKLAIFQNEFNNKNNLGNDEEEIDFETMLKQEKELIKIGNKKKSKNKK